MLDPTSPDAYSWSPPADKAFVEAFDAGYLNDLQAHTMPLRFIAGIEPGDVDVEEFKLYQQSIWQIPEPVTVTFSNVDPEVLEILCGQPIVPLYARQIPCKGTE